MSPRLPLRRLAALLLLAAVAVAVAACGSGSSDGGSSDAASLVRQTFAADHPIRSGRVDATLNVDLQGLPSFSQPLSLHVAGPFQSHGGTTVPDFALDLDLQSGSSPMSIGASFVQGAGYLSIEGQAFDLGKPFSQAFADGYRKAKRDAKGSGQTTLAALGIDPERWLQDPKRVGSEDIAGTQTDHITAHVDVPRLLDDLSTMLAKAQRVTGAAAPAGVPSRLTSAQRAAIARSIRSAQVDIWTGQQDRALRRLTLDLRIAVPKDLQARAGGLRSGHVGLDVTLAQLNQPQTIRRPANVHPASQLAAIVQQLGLGSASAGASGSPGSSSAGASSSAAPPSGAQAKYAQCLTAAGEDLAKVQRCAALLR